MNPLQMFIVEQLRRRQIIELLMRGLQSETDTQSDNQKMFLQREDEIIPKQQYQSYNTQIKQLFNSLFTYDQDDESPMVDLNSYLKFPAKVSEVPCCKKYSNKEKIKFYHCYNCNNNDNQKEDGSSTVLCEQCFENGQHQGHRYKVNMSQGKCDCGSKAKNFKGKCKNHNGEIPIVQFDNRQSNQFSQTMMTLLNWIFLLYDKNNLHNGQQLSCKVFKFLRSLNENSVYYNFLTCELLFTKKSQLNNQTAIQKIFKNCRYSKIYSNQIIQIIFSLFFLPDFRCKIAEEFVIAYNTVQGFQDSQFQHLIHQFIDYEQVLRYLTRQSLILKPKGIKYKQTKYLCDLLGFILKKNVGTIEYIDRLVTSLDIQVSFFGIQGKNLSHHPQMNQIISKQNIIEEVMYNQVMLRILRFSQYQSRILSKILNTIFHQILKFQLKTNKMVFPYERMFGMIVFTICEGDLNNLNIYKLLQIIVPEQKFEEAQAFLMRILSKVLLSLKQYSKTFIEGGFIDPYLLYYKGPQQEKTINFDILTAKICLILLDQLKYPLWRISDMLMDIFFQQQEIQNPEDPERIINSAQSLIQFAISKIKKNQTRLQSSHIKNQFLKIMLEFFISSKEQVYLRNYINIDNRNATLENEKLLKKISLNFVNFDQPLFQSLQSFIFRFNIRQKDYLGKNFILNQQNSRISLSQQFLKEVTQRYPIQNIQTIKKELMGFNSFIEQKQNTKVLIEKNQTQNKIANILLDSSFLLPFTTKQVFNFENSINFISQETTIKLKKEFKSFIQILQDINIMVCDNKNPIINNFLDQMKDKTKTKEKFNYLKDVFLDKKQQMDKNYKEKLQQKKSQKMKQFKEKHSSSFQSSDFDQKVEEEEVSACIVCRQKSKDRLNNLCYIAQFRYSNLIQCKTGTKGSFLVFNSCLHCIHMNCFTKIIKDKAYIECPLCKKRSNIIIPTQQQLVSQKQISLYIIQRIQMQRQSQELPNQNYAQVERNICLYILNSIVYKCCLNLAQLGRQLKQSQLKIMKILYMFAKNLYLNMDTSKKKQTETLVSDHMQNLNELQILFRKRGYSGYALFAILLKLFFQNVVNLPSKRSQIAQQFSEILENGQIQYCWNIVTRIVQFRQKMEIQGLKCDKQDKTQEQNRLKSVSQRTLRNAFTFYKPPKSIDQMFKVRDIGSSKCPKEHQDLICILCQWRGCYNCKKAKQHVQSKHLGQGILFNSFTGEIICYLRFIPYSVIFPSLYQNKLGAFWSPSKKPQIFELDNKKYQKILQQFINNQLQAYIIRKQKQLKFRNY